MMKLADALSITRLFIICARLSEETRSHLKYMWSAIHADSIFLYSGECKNFLFILFVNSVICVCSMSLIQIVNIYAKLPSYYKLKFWLQSSAFKNVILETAPVHQCSSRNKLLVLTNQKCLFLRYILQTIAILGAMRALHMLWDYPSVDAA